MPDAYVVLGIADANNDIKALYTLDGTHYGRLLLVFRPAGEIERFQTYAQETLKPGYQIRTIAVVAHDVNGVGEALKGDGLLPSGESRVALEGTSLFDEVISQLLTDTIWEE